MKRLLASCFGLGRLPVAPGTWGSLPAAIIFALTWEFGESALLTWVVMAGLALAGSIVCVKFASAAVAATGKSDPREVVADEFAGQAVTFLPICAVATGRVLAITLIGFLLFRLFDCTKPWPARKLEKLHGGWGILLDDLMAGVYAGVALLAFWQAGWVEELSESLSFDGSSLNVFSAGLLGAVQGLTEFLPISSSGHLVLFEKFLNYNPEEPKMLLFDLAVHVGTLAAIFVVFRKSLGAFIRDLFGCGKYGRDAGEIYRKSPSVRVLALGAVATIVTGIPGLLLEEHFVAARKSLVVVGLMWLITGTVLLITDWRKKARVGLRQFAVWQATVIGLAQAAAIMPGISRSGATICAAILVGLRRRWAIEFSFLIAIPAILGAAVIELVRNFEQINSGNLPIGSVVTGSVVAGLVGIAALKALIKTARSANLKFFAFYCYILACFLLVYHLR